VPYDNGTKGNLASLRSLQKPSQGTIGGGIEYAGWSRPHERRVLKSARGRRHAALEAVVRHFMIPAILIGALGLNSPSLARESTLHKSTLDDIKAVCDKVGGKLSQDAHGFGCGTDCHGHPGTDCTLYCKTDEKCVAQTMGGRRATSFENALKAPERHTR
jgi:hypothetical protein